jgi:hypothetical protein
VNRKSISVDKNHTQTQTNDTTLRVLKDRLDFGYRYICKAYFILITSKNNINKESQKS